jgi:hypothetical protein
MKDPAEIAYDEMHRALDSQADRLESLRRRSALVITTGAAALAFFASQDADGHGIPFALGTLAFLALVVLAMWIQQSTDWNDTFNGYELIDAYVDRGVEADVMFRDLTIFGQDDYGSNSDRLERVYSLLRWAIGLMALEIGLLTLDLWI